MKKNTKELNIFLKQIPFFSSWGNRRLTKFHPFLEKKSTILNQIMSKEGQEIQYVYIVIDGEFEVIKEVVDDNKHF